MTAPGLLSRAELPPWCKPWPDLRARFSIFYDAATATRTAVHEFVFIVDRNGAVRFEAAAVHTTKGVRIEGDAPVVHVPPEVLIAAGVEAIRKRRSGA